ncbi:hypothetical protein CLIB1423_11S02432 [[Candida] railenensis]|uniref:Zn(2)-C6 fungal-type domain-containing protein n=1 Tax=[Candida] railenensis TaxID=45579 RepID=A0A9P0QRR3_9ASCO|nr:hypothetical protein CLIB1423_11S02432 [[Candida] railenensis]
MQLEDSVPDTIAASKAAHVKYLADGKVMKVQKTRQRKILSCIHCHSKKIKCSRVQPVCNNCDKLGITCQYFVNKRVSRGGKKKENDSELIDIKNEPMSGCSDDDESPQHVHAGVAIGGLDSNGDTDANKALDNSQFTTVRQPHDSPLSTGSNNNSDRSHEGMHSNRNSEATSESSDSLPQVSDLNFNYIMEQKREHLPVQSLESQQQQQHHHHQQQQQQQQQQVPPSINSVLQTPVMNTNSNNITNNFFNTNYSNQTPQEGGDPYNFSMSTFVFPGAAESPQVNGTPQVLNFPPQNFTNFIDQQQNQQQNQNQNQNQTESQQVSPQDQRTPSQHQHMEVNNSVVKAARPQPNNPGLHNSLNAFPSNPETTMNYLYGTNTNYNNEQLLEELLKHLPLSRERSYELTDRYVNSVHILLPVMCNKMEGFLYEHDKFWDHMDRVKKKSSAGGSFSPTSSTNGSVSGASSNNGSSNSPATDLDILQFYTLYFPILYAATISEFEEYDNLLLNQDINLYLKAFNKICQYYNYPHGLKTIPLLLGNVIIQSTSPNPSTMEMSQIIRYAKFLHMHKDPIITLRITDWKVVKFRRMLWWCIFGLDSLTSHNFCLPPVCKFDDFNVLMPSEDEPIENGNNVVNGYKLNVGVLSLKIKFKYDRILSELVYRLHGLTVDISPEDTELIKTMIVELFEYIQECMDKMADHYRVNPPSTVQEMNLINFIKNHSWSYVDRALMLLHKKILLGDPHFRGKNARKSAEMGGLTNKHSGSYDDIKSESGRQLSALLANSSRGLSFGEYEDTFGLVQEANIISNFDGSTISQLKFNQYEDFTYSNLHNNLIPSILHNLNDFLKYNDFIKFGKYNWYVKRTIPLDSIILMFIVITVKFKYEFMTINEIGVYVKLINKSLFILNRKWFKNEKYKRMLSLANLTWEFMLKKYNIINIINQHSQQMEIQNEGSGNGGNSEGGFGDSGKPSGRIEFFDYQVTGYLNMNELFNVMDVPQPVLNKVRSASEMNNRRSLENGNIKQTGENGKSNNNDNVKKNSTSSNSIFFTNSIISSQQINESNNHVREAELMQLNEKIYYDLRNNFVDINDYCAFYSSLENIIHELMDYINR